MEFPASPEYQMVQVLAQHEGFSSYRAIRSRTNSECFLKCIVFDGDYANERFRIQVNEAIRLQTGLDRRYVLSANRNYYKKNAIFIEYPWLLQARWRPVSTVVDATTLLEVIPRLCFSLDYLHQLGLVHGDAKLSNFLYSQSGDGSRVLTSDLKFLCSEGQRLDRTIFGSPEHIAPEVILNDRILIQSDHYSLAESLRRILDRFESKDRTSSDEDSVKLHAFCHAIGADDYHKRPIWLLPTCYNVGLIGTELFQRLEKQLFLSVFKTRVKRLRKVFPTTPVELQKLVAEQCRVQGLSPEYLSALCEYSVNNPRGVWKACLQLIAQAGLEQVDRFWIIDSSDASALERFRRIDHVFEAAILNVESQPLLAMEYIRDYQTNGQWERAYLIAYKLFQGQANTPSSLDADNTVTCHALAGAALNKVGRFSEGFEHFRSAFELSKGRSSVRVSYLIEAALAGLRSGRYRELGQTWKEIEREVDNTVDVEVNLSLRRLIVWKSILEGDGIDLPPVKWSS